MEYSYATKGTCSTRIDFEMDGNVLHHVRFSGGCHGNLQAIGKLVEGMDADEVICRLEKIRCGGKSTSCPDQLAKALKSVKEQG